MLGTEIQQPKAAKIVVMGVGGAGCNAINSMVEAGVQSAKFIAINTDAQSLKLSSAEVKIAIGNTTTKGLGAGARPDVGRAAAEESKEEIRKYLEDVDMLFITAGMGGGTGTGAAPVIAAMARDRNILTIGVVTRPFSFEGAVRSINAEEGIRNLKENVDTLIVIQNDNLLKVLGNDVSFMGAFKHADSILRDAIKGLADLIATPTMINLDFADVKTIMQNKGFAHVAVGEAEGKDKIPNAVKQAVMSQLCETNIAGATGVLVSIVGGPNSLSLKEVQDAASLVRGCISADANMIFGAGLEESFGDKVQILLVATGFEEIKPKTGPFGATKSVQVPMPNDKFMQTFGIVEPKVNVEQRPTNNFFQQQPVQPIQPVQPVQQFNFDGQYTQPVQPIQNQDNTQQKRPVVPWLAARQNRNI